MVYCLDQKRNLSAVNVVHFVAQVSLLHDEVVGHEEDGVDLQTEVAQERALDVLQQWNLQSC